MQIWILKNPNILKFIEVVPKIKWKCSVASTIFYKEQPVLLTTAV